MRGNVAARKGEHRHFVRHAGVLEREGELLRPHLLPVADALPPGDRVSENEDARLLRMLRADIETAALIVVQREMFEPVPAGSAKRALSAIAINHAQSDFARCEEDRKRENHQQQA